MSSNKENQDGENENKKGGFIDNTDHNHLTPDDNIAQTPESKYFTNSNGTSIQSEQNLARGGNNNREGVNNAYGDGGDRPRSNPSDNQSDRGK